MIDLHIHTTASSDGAHDPAEIITFALEKGVKALAFADHNSIGSVAKGMELARSNGLRFVSAIELNSLHQDHDLHILAYGFDPAAAEIHRWLHAVEESKWEQAKGRTENLKKLGFAIEWEDVLERCGKLPPSGITFVKTLLGRSDNDAEKRLGAYRPGGSRADSPYLNFYLDYLRGGKPAFFPQPGVDTVDVIKKILDLRAVPVLAHPSDTPDEFIPDLIRAGLKGMEVHSTYHDAAMTAKWLETATRNKLLVTAGSDFHGESVKPGVRLGGVEGNKFELFEKLVGAIGHGKGLV